MPDPDSEFQIREPAQLREMAEFYGNRPCVELGKTPTTREISQGECADLSIAFSGAADEIEQLRKLLSDVTEQWASCENDRNPQDFEQFGPCQLMRQALEASRLL